MAVMKGCKIDEKTAFLVRDHLFTKQPNWLKFITPGLTWLLPYDDKIIYLTFDDVPVEKATPYVVDVLNDFKAKASFLWLRKWLKKYSIIAAYDCFRPSYWEPYLPAPQWVEDPRSDLFEVCT